MKGLDFSQILDHIGSGLKMKSIKSRELQVDVVKFQNQIGLSC